MKLEQKCFFLRSIEEIMKKLLFYLISITYGIIQILIGTVVFLFNIKKKHPLFHGAIIKN